MPHQCTSCERVFPNGSQQMLSGCPECEGNTFQYIPADTAPDSVPTEEPPERPGVDSSVAEKVGRAATKLRDVVSSSESDSVRTTLQDFANPTGGENGSTATARGSGPTGPATPSDAHAGESSTTAGKEAVDSASDGEAVGSASSGEPADDREPVGEQATLTGVASQADSGSASSQSKSASSESASDATSDETPDAASDETPDATSDEESDVTSDGDDRDLEGRPEDGYDAVVIDEGPGEDFAQSSARTDLVSTDELPDGLAGFGYRESAAPEPESTDGEIIIGDDHIRTNAPQTPADERDDSSGSNDSAEATDSTGASDATDPASGENASRADDATNAASTAAASTPAAPDPTATVDRPDLSELRAELNDQFESIKIVEPGQYELNLMELYEREETIIALKENGRYVIDVPDTWHGTAED